MGLVVCTPTYNRAAFLPRLYQSLIEQTNRNFSWLVVDDGSTDSTAALVRRFQSDASIRIDYIHQENGGKMRAHNAGVRAVTLSADPLNDLFVCLDSDDLFTKNAVNEILCAWNALPDKKGYAGIIAHKGQDQDHILYGSEFTDSRDTTLSGLYRRGFRGETTLVIRTDILKRHLFPEIEGEKYVPEDLVYDEIDREYVWTVLPKVLTICELIESGYSDRVDALREENPAAWYIYYVNRAKREPMSVLKLKYASHAIRFRDAVRKNRVNLNVLRENPLPREIEALGMPGAAVLGARNKL